MDNTHYKLDSKTFNSLFPFHIITGKNLIIKKVGLSIKKLFPTIKVGNSFSEFYSPKEVEPFTNYDTSNSKNHEDITVILKNSEFDMIHFKGQIITHENEYLFIISPVFTHLNEILDQNIIYTDFLDHSPQINFIKDLKEHKDEYFQFKSRLDSPENNLHISGLDKKNQLDKASTEEFAKNNGVVFCKSNGQIYWCNDEYEKLTGFDKSEIYGKTPLEVGKSAESDEVEIKKMITAFKNKESFQIDLIHTTKQGGKFWSRSKGQPIIGENGQFHYFAMIDDISDYKLGEEKLHILSSIADKNINAVIISDKHGKIEWINQSFEKMTGYSLAEVVGKKPGTFLQGEDTDPETVKYIKNQISKGEPFNCDIVNYSKSKQKYWVRIQGQALKDKYGNIFNFFAIEQDVSLEKNFLESIKAEKEKYSNVIASMKMGLLEVNLSDEILFANESFCEMTGYAISELIGKKSNFFYDVNEDIDALNFKYVKKDGSNSYEIKAKTKDGTIKHILISGAPNYNIRGELVGSIGVHLDITDQKNLENQKEQLLLRLEKQNVQLNEYAQIVAHDLKSPLRSIHALISWIKEDNPNAFNANTLDYLNKIESKVEKMDHFIQGILTYSKIDTIELTTDSVDVNEIITNLVSIIHIPDNVTVEIARKLPVIMADKYRLQQLFQNLIGNAVTYVDKNPGLVKVDFTEEASSYIFSIEDNGPGIAKENQKKVFAIFQSFTKNEHSTGIGLSIVKRIIDNYKGEIWIESEVTKGTTFFVRIPKIIT